MNPSCPICGKTLVLETHDIKPQRPFTMFGSVAKNKRPWGRGQYYVCHIDNLHWRRGSTITEHTAREGLL